MIEDRPITEYQTESDATRDVKQGTTQGLTQPNPKRVQSRSSRRRQRTPRNSGGLAYTTGGIINA